MAKSPTKQNNGPSLRQEIGGVVGIVLALFLFICLFSFSVPLTSEPVAPESNLGGPVGYLLASLLMSFLGISSLWLPAILVVFGVLAFSATLSMERIPAAVCGGTGAGSPGSVTWQSLAGRRAPACGPSTRPTRRLPSSGAP